MGIRLVRLPDLRIGVDENGREPLRWKVCKAIICGIIIAPILFCAIGFFKPDDANNRTLLVTMLVSIPTAIALLQIASSTVRRWLASRLSSQ